MSENANNAKNKKVIVRSDVFDAFRDLTQERMDDTINDLRTDLLNLNLHDSPTEIDQPSLQDEAAALLNQTHTKIINPPNANNTYASPAITNLNKNPDRQNLTFYGRHNSNRPNNGTVPRTRTNMTSHSDDELLSPQYTSAFAQSMQYNRNSGNFNYMRNNPNFNRRPFQNQQYHNDHNNYNYNVNNNNNPQNQTINDILQMAVLVPNFDGTENNFENFEIACQDASKIQTIQNRKIFYEIH